MDLGLGNLIELKRHLLPTAQVSTSTYNAAITAIGKGVAGAFDRLLNRELARGVGVQDVFSADRSNWVLRRYPLESVDAIDQRDDVATGWESLVVNDTILNQDERSGMLLFGGELGDALSRVRVTYTGGYWVDTSEDASETKPADATALPEDIKLAWLIQCERVWSMHDKMGESLSAVKTVQAGSLEVSPQVREMLWQYTRMSLT